MIFSHTKAPAGSAAGPSIATVRVFTAVALAAFPAGALIRNFSPDTPAGKWIALIGGFGLMLVALVAGAAVLDSRLYRIVEEDSAKLDEMELQLRHKVLSRSYSILGAAALLTIVYAGIAADAGWWRPTSFEEYNGVFWGAFLYVNILSATLLAWAIDSTEELDED